MNEYLKSGDKSFVLESSAKIEKVAVNKRLKTFILSKGPEDAPFPDAGKVRIAGWSKNKGIAEPFLEEEHYGPETDVLYYPIVNKTKLEEVKTWMLTWWDIAVKDFIKQLDKSKSADYWAIQGMRTPSKFSMVTYNDLKEPASLKKYAKHLNPKKRPMFFKDMNKRFHILVVDCYSISGSAKEMEVICKQMGNELEKQLDSYINTIVASNDAGQKFRKDFAKKIGFVKYKHCRVPQRLVPDAPKSGDARQPSPEWNTPEADKIDKLPSAPGVSDLQAKNKLHRELSEKGERIFTKLQKNYAPYERTWDVPDGKKEEKYEFDFIYGILPDHQDNPLDYLVCYVRVDMLNLEITLIDESGKQWKSGKLNKINAKIIDDIMNDMAPEENGYQLKI